MGNVMGKKRVSNEKRRNMTYRLVGSALLCLALLFSTMLMSKAENLTGKMGNEVFYAAGLALSLAFFEVLRYYDARHKAEGKFVYFRLGFAAMYLAALIAFAFSFRSSLAFILGATFILAVSVVKRVASIVRNHSRRNIALNVIVGIVNMVALSASMLMFMKPDQGVALCAILLGLVTMFTCLMSIVNMALSNFNAALLRKIVRKTYAGEIIFGLLLMIVAFSLAIMHTEDQINSFGDALWYCFAVVTTIGFGDFTTTGLLGRILTVILGIYGIVVVSIVTSIIVNFYNEVKSLRDDDDETDEITKAGEDAEAAEEGGDALAEKADATADDDGTGSADVTAQNGDADKPAGEGDDV